MFVLINIINIDLNSEYEIIGEHVSCVLNSF